MQGASSKQPHPPKQKKKGLNAFVHSIFRSTLHDPQHHPHCNHIHSFYNCTIGVVLPCECDIELVPRSSAGARFMTRCTRRFIVLPLCYAVTSSWRFKRVHSWRRILLFRHRNFMLRPLVSTELWSCDGCFSYGTLWITWTASFESRWKVNRSSQ